MYQMGMEWQTKREHRGDVRIMVRAFCSERGRPRLPLYFSVKAISAEDVCAPSYRVTIDDQQRDYS